MRTEHNQTRFLVPRTKATHWVIQLLQPAGFEQVISCDEHRGPASNSILHTHSANYITKTCARWLYIFIRGLFYTTRVGVQVQQEAADTLDLQADKVPAAVLSKYTISSNEAIRWHSKIQVRPHPKTKNVNYLMRREHVFLLP